MPEGLLYIVNCIIIANKFTTNLPYNRTMYVCIVDSLKLRNQIKLAEIYGTCYYFQPVMSIVVSWILAVQHVKAGRRYPFRFCKGMSKINMK